VGKVTHPAHVRQRLTKRAGCSSLAGEDLKFGCVTDGLGPSMSWKSISRRPIRVVQKRGGKTSPSREVADATDAIYATAWSQA